MSQITPELIAGILGLLISLAVKYVPSMDDWYTNKLDSKYKGLVMLAASLVVVLLMLVSSCLKIYDLNACNVETLPQIFRNWASFVISNQGIHLMTGDSKAKTIQKAEAKIVETEKG